MIHSPGETLPMKRFALSVPPPSDPRFDCVRNHLVDTVTREAIRLRVQCAIANGVSFLETAAEIVPDPDRPNIVTVTARPIAVVEP
jgi:hypothetical protein